MVKNGKKWSTMETKLRFIGFKIVNIEENGRIIIPSVFRENLASKIFFVIPGREKVLHVYPELSFLKLEEKIEKLESEEEKSIIINTIFANSRKVARDSLWRISIPQQLLDHANLKNEVKIVGAKDKLDFWNPDIHEEFNRKLLSEKIDLFKKVGL
ncbi:MAG: hypothetical protein QME48_04910 [bacterium]|uniref:Transcriptional regulator MraZ n=2 Tax=Bacteria candidate phyla TaxID=1783234 RepID=A0A101I2Q5_UNCT6|nr:MAG: Protein MraZ [candidate division TA06 bacterium 32_111]KUK87917.1 MAG: Protein MraZ [candidate division TA06 bacterium 34_109]MDI6700554.1 hypothetical protein [bacterium]HAF08070.1 hypothetical protein [candidate division WOR-3 bacterium]HCP16229.1 hypothetical protein [candidate division WOR-3 bacterium]